MRLYEQVGFLRILLSDLDIAIRAASCASHITTLHWIKIRVQANLLIALDHRSKTW